MSGGGKGGKKTEETTIPEWLRGPAARNLQRAEAVQQLEYMPYYGPDVAAFTPAQNAAFDTNIGAAEAFGLLAPNTLTATSGMPTPTDWDGFTGYSSQPIYESALSELQAKQPGAVAQYDALFGGAVPSNNFGGGGGGRFRGSAGGGVNPGRPYIPGTDLDPMGGPRRGTGGQDRAAIRAKRDKNRALGSVPLTTPNYTLTPPININTSRTLGQQQDLRQNFTLPSTRVPPWLEKKK